MNDTNIDKNKTYKFVFSSLQGAQLNPGTNNKRGYNVDWSIMPDQPYFISFNYVGAVNNINGAEIPMVYADFMAMTSVYEPTSTFGPVTRTQAKTSTFLGVVKYKDIGATGFLYADNNTNPPVYIASRPRTNQLIIDILNQTGTSYVPAANDLNNYVITMHFVPA